MAVNNDEVYSEKSKFLHWFVRGSEDVFFYGAGYDDQRHNPGYEEGVVLGLREPEMDYAKAQQIAEMLYENNLKVEKENEKIHETLKKLADATGPLITPSELMLATTTRYCSKCEQSHAPIRSCDGSTVTGR